MSAWFDPRLTVFVIWGIFVVLFICIPSKRILQRILFSVGCTCCGYEEEIVPANNDSGGPEVQYEILSNARKQELDSLRASHLTYRMHPFSLTLDKKYMSRRCSDSSSSLNVVPQDRMLNDSTQCQCTRDDDIETGSSIHRGMDPPERDDGEGEDVQYTHVSVPLPGHNFDCVDVINSQPKPTKVEKKPQKEEKRSKMRIFGATEKEEIKENKEDPNNATDMNNESGERRNCSIFCAICLAEYEPSERVSWSSNPACTHVFHEDCVVQWLVSLGKTKSKLQRFSEQPSEAQLLNYQLECPCCRQEFISRGQADLPDVCGDERV